MTGLPECPHHVVARDNQVVVDVGDDAVQGKAELLAFQRARAAYDPTEPTSEKALLAAFLRFHALGYAAYFDGLVAMPTLIAAEPLVAGMWMDGYHLAETEALTMTCKCDCSRRYVWGKGYGPCPRRRD